VNQYSVCQSSRNILLFRISLRKTEKTYFSFAKNIPVFHVCILYHETLNKNKNVLTFISVCFESWCSCLYIAKIKEYQLLHEYFFFFSQNEICIVFIQGTMNIKYWECNSFFFFYHGIYMVIVTLISNYLHLIFKVETFSTHGIWCQSK